MAPGRGNISRAVCAGIPCLIEHPLSVLPAQGAAEKPSPEPSSATQGRQAVLLHSTANGTGWN